MTQQPGAGTLQVQIRHQPSFAVARLLLEPGQRVRCASGALYMRAATLTYEAKMEGGFMGALKRSVGGQSFFTTTWIGDPAASSWLDLALALPGDITTLDIDPAHGIVLTQGSWLASTDDVQLDTKWGGFKSMLGGNRFFAVHLTGSGTAVVASYGALDHFTLEAGQSVVVDLGHVVGYDDGMGAQVQQQGGGFLNSVKSGEWLAVQLTGPGRVWTQSRSIRELSDWVREQVPSQTSSS
ncbi:MAG: TIGR00266 family protein [Candidatus Nanopelagicales bacterium]